MKKIIVFLLIFTCLTACTPSDKKTYYEIPKSEVVEPAHTPSTSSVPKNATDTPSVTPKPTSKETPKSIDKNTDTDFPDPINLLNAYAYSLVDAINSGNFSTVEEYLLKDSNLYKSQQKLVNNLYSKEITEKLVSIEVIEEDWQDDSKCFVSTKEIVEIHYSSGKSETNTYYWTYTMLRSGEKYYLTDIIKYVLSMA